MRSHRHILAAMAAVFMTAGCQPSAQQPQATDASPTALTGDPSTDASPAERATDQESALDPTTGDRPPDEVELLMQKTQAYARSLDEELNRSGRTDRADGATDTADAPNAADLDGPSGPAANQPSRNGEVSAAASQQARPPQTRSSDAEAPHPAQPKQTAPAPPADGRLDGEAGTANRAVAIDDPDSTSVAASGPIPGPPRAEAESDGTSAAQSLESTLARHVKDNPRDPVAHLNYQLLRYIEGRQVPELGTLASLPDEDQEIITAVLDSLSNFRNNIRADSNLLLSRKIRPLMDLGERLRTQADLQLPTLQLCRRVEGFGVYEPLEHRFVAGRARDVIVYCEVANFMSQYTEQSQWETRLTEEIVLYTDSDGLPILRDKPVVVADQSRNRRQDFFIVRKLRLPANIPVGRYWLKVTVVDQLASRVAETSIPITFVATE